ncbi:MAG: M28 family peptidase, partial [Gemmatimonadota bacterium]
GRYGAYESGEGPDMRTHVLAVTGDGIGELRSVPGAGLMFSPTGDGVAFLTVPETPALREARARIEEEFGGTDRAARMQLRTEMERLNVRNTLVTVLNLVSGEERLLQPLELAVSSVFFGPGNALYLVGGSLVEGGGSDIFRVEDDGSATRITEEAGQITDPFFVGSGTHLVYGAGRGSFHLLELATGKVDAFQGSLPVLSANHGSLAYLEAGSEGGVLKALSLTPGGVTETVLAEFPFEVSMSATRSCTGCPLQSGLALAPGGDFAVVQALPREDWELFLVPLVGSLDEREVRQVTREIQHDLYPTILADGRLLAMKGEGRHRRSHLYDLRTGEKIWLFRNNTVRTVAPEYEWAPSPDGTKLLLVAERDGNTVSPDRGIYLMDLTRRVTREELLVRIRTNLEAERELRAQANVMYGPVSGEIREVVDQISLTRIFDYEEAMFQFGSKNVTQPGNRSAIDYIAGKLREFGFEPELQWFDARGVQSANVVARIPGTVSPDVVYAVSAHFDSNSRSPGADDNTSATVGLLEMARVLAHTPMPATIEIALFTGEESGLLGSREYVRRAVESGTKLVGALNNDMVGFAEDHRLDNTIRYSNAGIRDLQHGAAILFSEMVTYDAEYYKSTDAAAYYDAYGDIVGGIGSYPILASPHYHQSHDVLETINHKLVTEVARISTASIMLLASVPSRLGGLEARWQGDVIEVSWTPALEADVTGYQVAFGTEDDPLGTVLEVAQAGVTLENLPAGTVISVKAVNERGMEGWDWARVRVEK